MKKNKIVHIITSLSGGGAETMLYKLLKYADRNKYQFEVISMIDEGVFGPKIRKLGIQVHTLGMKRGIPNLLAIKRAKSIIKDAHIIQTWMYHADLFGFLVKKHRSTQKLFWGIRRSNLDRQTNKRMLLGVARINAYLSNKVDLIISCSSTAVEVHSSFGYDSSNMLTIPNGFELDTFYNDPNARASVEKELDFSKDMKIVAHVGRWDIQKDYPNLLKAAQLTIKEQPKTVFLLCGKNIDIDNRDLAKLIMDYEIEKNVFLLGRREDIPRILSAADIFVSSSLGEGFPNVIGEAMACETPCVVTNVGDSSHIVSSTGIVVPAKNAEKLAKETINLLKKSQLELKEQGRRARERVLSEFEITKVTKRFEELYEK